MKELEPGSKFNYLTIIHETEIKNNRRYFLCQCICGNKTTVRIDSILNGHIKSCGCLYKQSNKKHGLHQSRLYSIWEGMKQRCYNPKDPRYYDYGGRNITICNEWLEFLPFYNWAMNNRYSDNLTIDRKNTYGNYEPDNCKWSTVLEQANNTRANKFITYKGETRTISQWAKHLNIERSVISWRWDIKEIFEKPIQYIKNNQIQS